jgi:hypothetical protein
MGIPPIRLKIDRTYRVLPKSTAASFEVEMDNIFGQGHGAFDLKSFVCRWDIAITSGSILDASLDLNSNL